MPSTQALESWQRRSATELLLANLLHRADRSQAVVQSSVTAQPYLSCAATGTTNWTCCLDSGCAKLKMCSKACVLQACWLSYASSSQLQNAMYTLSVIRECSCQVVVNLKRHRTLSALLLSVSKSTCTYLESVLDYNLSMKTARASTCCSSSGY